MSMTKKSKNNSKSKSKQTRKQRSNKQPVCAPKIEKGKRNKTIKTHGTSCLMPYQLNFLKERWNEMYDGDDKQIITSTSASGIWKSLNKRMKKQNNCLNEICWLYSLLESYTAQDIASKQYRINAPELVSPKTKDESWLTNFHIDKFMKQYEEAYPNFKYLDTSPIDWDTKHSFSFDKCVSESLCNIDLSDLYNNKGKSKLGIVFNTHPHTKGGEHWICMFIDLEREFIVYFDSYGKREKVPKEVERFINKIVDEAKISLGIKLKIHKMQKRHQYGNGECGMYCLFTIVNLLKGREPEFFEKERISDTKMKELRNKYFNNIKSVN